jgi:hypothetical protein
MVWLILAAAVLALAALLIVPRILIARGQNRLARQKLERLGSAWKLLTRADLVVSRYRRLPGLLGLTDDRIAFAGLFGEMSELATSQIRKIVTGRRLSNGRMLLRLEVLRVTPSEGEELEFVLSRASAAAWRSHLGLWAAREKQAEADRVTPGRR